MQKHSLHAFLKSLEENSQSATSSIDREWQLGIQAKEPWAILTQGARFSSEAEIQTLKSELNLKSRIQKVAEVKKRAQTIAGSFHHNKVLVVDDDTKTLDLLREILEEIDVSYFGATGVRSAIKFLKENKDVELLIVDYELSDGTGIQLMNTIKSLELQNIPTIFISGHTQPEYIKNAAMVGVKHWIVKPVNPEQLIDTVDALLLQIAQ